MQKRNGTIGVQEILLIGAPESSVLKKLEKFRLLDGNCAKKNLNKKKTIKKAKKMTDSFNAMTQEQVLPSLAAESNSIRFGALMRNHYQKGNTKYTKRRTDKGTSEGNNK
jgi:hypothetical protein